MISKIITSSLILNPLNSAKSVILQTQNTEIECNEAFRTNVKNKMVDMLAKLKAGTHYGFWNEFRNKEAFTTFFTDIQKASQEIISLLQYLLT